MLISIGVDIGARNGAIAIIDENFKILYLDKAPFMEVDLSHTSANRTKPKLNKETGKYEISYRKRAWTDYTQLRELFKPYVKHKIVYNDKPYEINLEKSIQNVDTKENIEQK